MLNPLGKKPNLAKISQQNDSNSMISNLARENFSRRGRKTTRVGNGSGWCLTIEWSLFCSECRTFATADQDKKGPFVVGTNKFKLENIKGHELSKSHFFFFFFLNLLWKPKQTCHWHTGRRVRAATHVSSTRKGDETNEELVGEWIFCGRVEI